MDLVVVGMIVVVFGGMVGLGLFIHGIAGLARGDGEALEQSVPAELRSKGFRVIAIDEGAGRYRVDGVHRDSEDEVSIVIEAQTRANAAAKAELRGILVTAIEKVG